jgi:uncharacterized protein YcbK (DUF882 family)
MSPVGLIGMIQVISGYRSPHTNAALRGHSSGVAEHSLHMRKAERSTYA